MYILHLIPWEIIPPTLETIGTVFIAFAALRVHHRVLNEHKIDEQVFSEMKRERKIGIMGVFLVIAGYSLHVFLFFA